MMGEISKERDMKGDSFRKEKIVMSHEDCNLCERIAKIAIDNFRESNSERTLSSSGEHWVEVTRNSPHPNLESSM